MRRGIERSEASTDISQLEIRRRVEWSESEKFENFS